ncbi:DNA-binding protein C1D involved in regulation of double-strand break repair [Phaffia rhodozyma]|uniref:Exosome complex protein n=1 Tax=Phaffia rhodozyma TaxID=264483 RepID=A0A0F7SW44_PHARH|nr:DNA-binding protein C1D involved in regulation of double-strand break repair [Phaffia rhodozyma]
MPSSSEYESESEDETEALSTTIDELASSLSAFDSEFMNPLLARPLKETLAQMSTEMDKAKLLVNIVYVLLDLIWIYLRTKGIDPESHPVIPELERIKSYFAKVKNAENPEKRRFELDRQAASRFIKSALQSQTQAQRASSSSAGQEPMEIGMQTRFNILKHQEAALREKDGDDDDDDDEVKAEKEVEKEVEIEVVGGDDKKGGKKSKRPRVDAFAGYDDSPSAPVAKATAVDSSASTPASVSSSSSTTTSSKKSSAPKTSSSSLTKSTPTSTSACNSSDKQASKRRKKNTT